MRRRLERYRRRRARQAGWTRRFVPTSLPQLDALLPHGGLPCGAVTELLSEAPGVGAMSLAMRIAAPFLTKATAPLLAKEGMGEVRSFSSDERVAWASNSLPVRDAEAATGWHGRTKNGHVHTSEQTCPPEAGHATPRGYAGWHGRANVAMCPPGAEQNPSQSLLGNGKAGFIVFVDTSGDFYPPEAVRRGVPLERLIVIRPPDDRTAFWAVDQSLRCSAVSFVIAPLAKLDERASRRLQLAAESSGAIGLILRTGAKPSKSFAAVRLLVEPVPGCHGRANGWRGRTKGGHVHASEQTCPPKAGHATLAGHATRLLMRDSAASLAASLHEPHPVRLTLIKVREGMPAGPVVVDLNHETHAGAIPSLPLHRPAVQTGT